jgi:putative copper resistance protein D
VQGFADFSDGLLGGAILVALAVALGGVAFALLVVPRDAGDATDALRARAALVLAWGAALLALCQVVVLGLKAIVLAGYLGPDIIARYPGTLQFRAGVARAACAAALAAAALLARRQPAAAGRWAAVVALAAATALAGAWLVHAAARLDDRARMMTLTVLHQVAASVWAGGLIHLGSAWRLGRRDQAVRALWPRLLARFSTFAVASVAALVVFALPLTAWYVASLDGLVGTGYGSLVVTKVGLLAVALLLASGNRGAVRGFRRRGDREPLHARAPYLIEAETILVVVLLFTAASLSSQPPARDTTEERATVAEVIEVFRPKMPNLRTPSVGTMLSNSSDPYAAVGGERTAVAYSWSNFSHNVAGLFVLAMSLLALASARWRWARHWPLALVALGVFVFLRSLAVDGVWPFGPRGFWQTTLLSAEDMQHRLAAVLAVTLGLVEWRARRDRRPDSRLAYVFPALAAAGGLLLLVHSHVAFELKSSYLVQVTHTFMGALAILIACGRLLELRLESRLGRLAGVGASLAMLLIALTLIFYREANIVVPPDAVAAAPGPLASRCPSSTCPPAAR